MNCSQIEKLLPLYVSHDLAGRQAQLITLHLPACEACRQAAAEYRQAQEFMRDFTSPIFGDEVYDEIRKGVWQQIEAEQKRPSLFDTMAVFFQPRLVWTAVAALVLSISVVAAYLLTQRTTPRPDDFANVPKTVLPMDWSAEGFAGGSREPRTRNTESRQAKMLKRERKPGRMVAPDQAGSVAAYSPDVKTQSIDSSSPVVGKENLEGLRLELQTRDPNIRIIWFTNRDSKPVANSKGI